jgi:multidrug transporter EmrE-like cation transporter
MVSVKVELFLGVFIGLIAYITLYIGKGIQKYAIEGFKEDRTIKSKHSGIWIFGTILTALFVFIQMIPLTVFHTPMNLIAPLEGVGLVCLLFFSFFVLKESISKTEVLSVVLIIAGTILINIATKDPVELIQADFNRNSFLIAFGILMFFSTPLVIIGFLKPSNVIGIMLGLNAGCFMAFQTLAKRIIDIGDLALIFTFVMFAFATVTLTLTQFAFTMARANVVVPSFATASIILTIVLGIFVIGETIVLVQIIGIVCIILGIIVMNLFQQTPENVIKDNKESL